jgi:hypothetical protein
MAKMMRVTQPKADNLQDLLRALIEIVDRVNQLVEAVNDLEDRLSS